MTEDVISRFSEKVPATGTISGDATRRTLGKSDLSFWDVFLRETLQNSWDARLADDIDFAMDAVHFDDEALKALREVVFAEGLPSSLDDDLGRFLASRSPAALIVRDEGTRGLAGPARSDLAIDLETRTDFRNFVFDIGRNLKRPTGGGTYGFGKGVLYEASALRMCLVYTRTEFDGGLHDRFIATRVGSDFEHDSKRFTGRHWWGWVDGEAVLPVEGAAARDLAERLGMSVADGATGTVVSVLQPIEPGGADKPDLDTMMEALRKAALQWAWPHLAESPKSPSIRFRFSLLGAAVPVKLEDEPELQQFAAAYREALKYQADEAVELSFQVSADRLPLDTSRPKTGVLVVRKALQAETMGKEINGTVALMRGPRLVVKYEKIVADPHGQYTAGVFLVDPTMEDHFAKAEPVTHDSWAREPGRSKMRPVSWTLRDIQTATDPRLPSTDPSPTDGGTGGVAHLSRVLGESVMGTTGTGPEKQGGKRPGAKGPRRDVTVRLHGDPMPFEVSGDRIVVDFPIKIEARTGIDASAWHIQSEPRIVAEAGGRDVGNGGLEKADIISWHAGDAVHEGARIRLDLLLGADVFVRVIHDRDAAITVTLTKERNS